MFAFGLAATVIGSTIFGYVKDTKFDKTKTISALAVFIGFILMLASLCIVLYRHLP